MPRHEDDEAFGIEAAEIVKNIEPGAVAKANIEKDDIRRFFFGQAQPFLGGLGTENLDIATCEHLHDAESNYLFVVDH
jgi:3-oxoacyl-[acyl-carrier-protein] synthase III